MGTYTLVVSIYIYGGLDPSGYSTDRGLDFGRTNFQNTGGPSAVISFGDVQSNYFGVRT